MHKISLQIHYGTDNIGGSLFFGWNGKTIRAKV